jgi:hypothetical protein
VIELRRATVFGPSSPSPCASDRRWLVATNPNAVDRPLESSAGTMPAGLRSVNDGHEPEFPGLIDGG